MLIDRMNSIPYESSPASVHLVPVYDHSVHLSLADEAAQLVGRHGGDDLVMIVDSHTIAQLHSLNELRKLAKSVIVFGDTPSAWGKASNVYTLGMNDLVQAEDHLFILVSSRVCIAILGSAHDPIHDDDSPFQGGWTVQSAYVEHVARALLGTQADELLSPILEPTEASPQVAEMSIRLMALQARTLATRQQDIAMDKSDLSSVLQILKAISAKRRSHDILFIFVEQIARVVSSNRCSVVRIWGSEDRAQVMASHEDANLSNRTIELGKYPELSKSLSLHERVVINDVHNDPLTAPFSEDFRRADINAVLVIPIVLYDENVGSLFLRAARSKGSFSLREISFFEIVTEAASNALERAQLFESIQIANENLERLAITDGLTGLYNHRYFRDRLDQELERALRYRLPLSCLILDVDNFKRFNDTYGHLMGDSILKEIAERTQQCVRKCDIVARYGGEEYVVIMPQTNAEGGMVQAERIRELIDTKTYRDVPDGESVTVSVGVGVLNHDKMLICEDILREADQALYEAKRTGKNKVVGPRT